MAQLSLGTRLTKLEPRLLPRPGCERCRDWTGVLLVGDDGPPRPVVRVLGVGIGRI